MNKDIFKVVLLFALPASGKSEVRNLLAHVDPEILKKEFHIGDNVQLDDFPYVYFMRCIDEKLVELGQKPIYAENPGSTFYDKRTYGALIRMLNEDYEDLFTKKQIITENISKYYLDRWEKACHDSEMTITLTNFSEDIMQGLYTKLEPLCKQMLKDKYDNYPDTMEGKTCVIEMARGGAKDHTLPLQGQEGYQYTLKQFSDHILSDAAILYIWVTPEESRRKNHERALPNAQGSSLNHETPIEVMYSEYGVCDMIYLKEHSEKENTVTVKNENGTYYIPIGVFDNRVDKTTPFRDDPSTWNQQLVDTVTVAIKEATDIMWDNYSKK